MISPTEEIIQEIAQGRMVILIDEEDRENEGDLVLGAQFTNAHHINFMATYGRGLICLALMKTHCQQLGLSAMVKKNEASLGTNFTISIEAARGVTTGISASDRAVTIQTAIAQGASPQDIISPGHVFPLIAEDGGVLMRAGHTEASCDLSMLANIHPSAVICEILKEDGEMARLADLVSFSQKHQLKIGTIADLIHYRHQHETLIVCYAQRLIKTPFGEMNLVLYQDKIKNESHIALVKGDITEDKEILVRVHEPLSVLDLLDMSSHDHSWNALRALQTIQQSDCGVMLLLHSTGSKESLLNSIQHADQPVTSQNTLRHYGIGSQILRDLGVRKMRLMANPRKMPNMAGFGLQIVGYQAQP